MHGRRQCVPQSGTRNSETSLSISLCSVSETIRQKWRQTDRQTDIQTDRPVDGEVRSVIQHLIQWVDHAAVVNHGVDVLCQILVIQQVQSSFTHRRVCLTYNKSIRQQLNTYIHTGSRHVRHQPDSQAYLLHHYILTLYCFCLPKYIWDSDLYCHCSCEAKNYGAMQWKEYNTSSSAMAERPRELDQRFQMGGVQFEAIIHWGVTFRAIATRRNLRLRIIW